MADRPAFNIAERLLARECGIKAHRPRLTQRGKDAHALDNQHLLDGNANQYLNRWAEDHLLCKSIARYCNLQQKNPDLVARSTIAAAFSPDGRWLASTHGDHTVKMTDVGTATVAFELRAHKRTPWVVRFHPNNDILVSGSLDNQVILWNLEERSVIGQHNFGRPITSIAFCAGGNKLLVAAGHRLWYWEYTILTPEGKPIPPSALNRYRRSLRAAHFQPMSNDPLLLTAEVDDMDVLKDRLGPVSAPLQPSTATAGVGEAPSSTGGLGMRDVDLWLAMRPDAAIPTTQIPQLQDIPPNQRVAVRPHQPPFGVQLSRSMITPLLRTVTEVVEQPFFQASPEVPWMWERVPRWSGGAATGMDPLPGNHLACTHVHQNTWDNHEIPCIVRLKLQPFDPSSSANFKSVLHVFQVDHVVLCSEMGLSFSPCGRFLACCVLCADPSEVAPPKPPMSVPKDAPAPKHPGRKVVYELRVYSIMTGTFGQLLQARCIKAAHCLTCIQFSPASNLLVLAYGRRHEALCSLITTQSTDGNVIQPLYTALEVYRVSDLALLRILPTIDDEVNVAVFHPVPGRGLAYGTKEGRLRLIEMGALPEPPAPKPPPKPARPPTPPAPANDAADMLLLSLLEDSTSDPEEPDEDADEIEDVLLAGQILFEPWSQLMFQPSSSVEVEPSRF